MRKTNTPFFTIVTSTLNMATSIERCIESVAEQTCRDYEHIVVDGASTDGTIEFLNSKSGYFSVLISEPDTGIYNAWNKALKHARGEWVLFLGADDILADKNVLRDVAAFIKEKGAKSGIVYGDVMLVAKGSYEERECIGVPPEKIGHQTYFMCQPELPPHPATFHHCALFEKRKFDENMKISSDAKLLLEVLFFDKVPFLHTARTINKMTPGGTCSAVGSQSYIEILQTMDDLGLHYSKVSAFIACAKARVKVALMFLLGEKYAYRFVDRVRILRGQPRLWS